MKKIFFVALAATLLAAGCQKTEIINKVGDTINFSSEIGKLTKAGTGDLTTLKAQDFKVWVYTAYTDALNGVQPGEFYDGMIGLVIEDNADGKWAPQDKKDYYWPGKEHNLEFYAISTTQDIVVDYEGVDKATVNTAITPGPDKKIVITGYTVDPETATDDLMVADFVTQNQKSDNNSKKVNMNFRHALSQVTFAFNTTGDKTVKVSKIEVADLVVNGVLTAVKDATATETETTTPIKIDWTKAPTDFIVDTDDFTKDIPEDEQVLSTGDHVPFVTWKVIPQDLADKTVKISYQIGDKPFTHVFPLASTALPKGWEVNHSITYNVSLSPNTISFDASVEEWTEKTPIEEIN